MRKIITIDEIEKIIELNSKGHLYPFISKELNVAPSSISRILLRYNLKCNYKPQRVCDYDLILKLSNEKMSPIQIARKLNYNPVTVNSILITNGIRYRKNQGNIRYFEKIDSHRKAYFLGFIAADGCIQSLNKHCKGLSITIHSKDKYILEYLIKEMKCDKQLLHLTTKMCNSDKYKDHVRFVMGNTPLYNDILQWGITEKKSMTMSNIIPNIPKEFRKSFILGYFDGDGCVMTQKQSKIQKGRIKIYPPHGLNIFIRGTKEFLIGIAEELNIQHYSIKFDKTHGLFFSRKEEVVKFFDCYKNCDIFLTRKHDIFLERICHPSWNKFIQVQTISSS
jgi:hypothetical protein